MTTYNSKQTIYILFPFLYNYNSLCTSLISVIFLPTILIFSFFHFEIKWLPCCLIYIKNVEHYLETAGFAAAVTSTAASVAAAAASAGHFHHPRNAYTLIGVFRLLLSKVNTFDWYHIYQNKGLTTLFLCLFKEKAWSVWLFHYFHQVTSAALILGLHNSVFFNFKISCHSHTA